MDNSHSRKIASYSALSGSSLALSLLAPRVLQFSEGFAGATSATLVFAGLYVLAALLAVYVLIYTIKYFRDITNHYRVLGVVPCMFILLSIAALYFKFISENT